MRPATTNPPPPCVRCGAPHSVTMPNGDMLCQDCASEAIAC